MKKTVRIYDPSFKEDAVLMSYKKNNLTKLEQELGIYEGALNTWRKIYQRQGLAGFKRTVSRKNNSENYKLSEFEKKINQSNLAFEILHRAGELLNNGKLSIFQFMENNENRYSVRFMSKVLEVNRGTYMRWKNRFNTDEYKRKIRIQEEISIIFSASAQCYGRDRIAAALHNTEFRISASTAGKYMKELGLHASLKTKFKKNGSV
ncbi:IS3 family transposase [Flavobacterium ustbae]|uniref:IS3 family transposase n=1 Tax=Flavobacterium ustbae TaxID=2488790 RepID=UPI000F778352|nr:IS3 family transposase [Flavobacterium ustbae]